MIGFFASGLFGAHVVRAAHGGSGGGHLGVVLDHFREAEVGYFDAIVAGEHEVAGFDIAVDDAAFAGVSEAFYGLQGYGDGVFGFEAVFAFHALGHGFAVDILHYEIEQALVIAKGVDVNDIGMVQAGNGSGLASESACGVFVLQEFFAHELYGDFAFEVCVEGKPDFAHSASAEEALELVAAKLARHIEHDGVVDGAGWLGAVLAVGGGVVVFAVHGDLVNCLCYGKF